MPYCNQCGALYDIGVKSCEKCGSTLPGIQEAQTERSTTDEIKSPKTKRFVAGVIDLTVAILLGCSFLLIRGHGLGAFLVRKSGPIFLPFIYLLLKDSIEGKSIGKVFMNILVYNIESKKPSGLIDSFFRNWVFALLYIAPIFWFVAAAQIISGKKKRIGEPKNTLVITDEEYNRLK